MVISTEERDIIRQILKFADQGTTQMLPEVMDNPVAKYTDPAQLEAEINTLFRNFPIVIAHTSELAKAGDFVTHDDTGVPILATRSEDGGVKAFSTFVDTAALASRTWRAATLDASPARITPGPMTSMAVSVACPSPSASTPWIGPSELSSSCQPLNDSV